MLERKVGSGFLIIRTFLRFQKKNNVLFHCTMKISSFKISSEKPDFRVQFCLYHIASWPGQFPGRSETDIDIHFFWNLVSLISQKVSWLTA